MPTWEAPRSAAEAAKAALKALRGGTQSQPRGIDALFKPPTTGPWSRDKQGAVLCALLIGVTVVLVSARRRRRTGDGLTVTINLQLSELPEEWKKIFSEAGVTQARTNAQNVHDMCITRHTCMRLHSLLLPHTDAPGGLTGGPAGPEDGAAHRRDPHGCRVQATPRRGTRAACGLVDGRVCWRRWRH